MGLTAPGPYDTVYDMTKVMSIRLSDKTRRTVARLAKTRRRSQSAVVREAIEAYVDRAAAEVRPYDAWKDVIGIVKGAPPDLSERTGEKFTALLIADRIRKHGKP